MSIAIALLVHQDLGRAAELVQALHRDGCKVAVHVDTKVALAEFETFSKGVLSLENVILVERMACDWGQFTLVQAQLILAEALLKKFADISHVVQLSGSCLPNRPIPELLGFLGRHPHTDIIESVAVGGVSWTRGGLEAERFSLYFPFSFVNNKRLFDISVKIQRWLGVKRKTPKGLSPHIGSQWWALTRDTLKAILSDPERPIYDKFFKACWIPDESYFQTLARKHGKPIKSCSLTYSRFDYRGKPMVFYDDHLRYLGHLDSFFVRKVWHGANALYQTLLAPNRSSEPRNPDMAAAFRANIAKSESRLIEGRKGLVMQSRAPTPSKQTGAARYTVLSGFDSVFVGLKPWLQQQTGIVLHEYLFSKNRKDFETACGDLKNNMGSTTEVRDYNKEGFLLNFVWNHSDDDPCFAFEPAETPKLARFIAQDSNARIFHIRSAWLLRLMREGQHDVEVLQTHALKEQAVVKALSKGKAEVRLISLPEALGQPGAVLEDLLLALRPSIASINRDIPAFLPNTGVEQYVESLKNVGLNMNVEFDSYPNFPDSDNE